MEFTTEARSIFTILDKYLQYRESHIEDAYTVALDLVDDMSDKWLLSDTASDFCKDIITRMENLK